MSKFQFLMILLILFKVKTFALTSYTDEVVFYVNELNARLKDVTRELENLSSLSSCCSGQEFLAEPVSMLSSLQTEIAVLQLQINRSSHFLPIKLHSPTLSVIHKEDRLCVPIIVEDQETYVDLLQGDHNLWYGDHGDIWGYDRKGRLFIIDKNGVRSILTNLGKEC